MNWRDEAACADMDPDIFFPEELHKMAGIRAVQKAKEVCATCPVASECLALALADREPGIWGGTTERERKLMLGLNPKSNLVRIPGQQRGPGSEAGCGTDAGYTRHRRRGEPACQACRDAHAQARRFYTARHAVPSLPAVSDTRASSVYRDRRAG